eukprot:Lithocolla_globosa_v1_NODE_5751_length_1191_cov_7.816901.p2 type:complete len:112 gc:universal NODE_5751_length_1191_cov_7.816901:514-179(-)
MEHNADSPPERILRHQQPFGNATYNDPNHVSGPVLFCLAARTAVGTALFPLLFNPGAGPGDKHADPAGIYPGLLHGSSRVPVDYENLRYHHDDCRGCQRNTDCLCVCYCVW